MYPKDGASYQKPGRPAGIMSVNPFSELHLGKFRISKRGQFDVLIKTLTELVDVRHPVKPLRFGAGRKRATDWSRLVGRQ
ncbi:hypothetical protein LSAT2_020012 [Lamellibrachia satsuma]|nr:hypothetical protein LSAT2_020012 [Lamellibrachia satsuma]